MWRWRGSGRSRQAGRGTSSTLTTQLETITKILVIILNQALMLVLLSILKPCAHSHTDFDAARVDAFRSQLLESAQARTIREDASHINAAFRSFCHGTSSTINPQTTETIRGSTERVFNPIRDDAFSTTEIGGINNPVASGNARYMWSEGISPPAASTVQSASPSSAGHASPSTSTSASSFASASLSSAASSTASSMLPVYNTIVTPWNGLRLPPLPRPDGRDRFPDDQMEGIELGAHGTVTSNNSELEPTFQD
ncbi:hypothetical protein BC938DRAFT_479359 [Jimgerdemannia flammicorona]|uniref:Uncharacterized protein n=1 Tax=Jimgerdemannia flammicorona TaxID=994334 RepID=A0A433QL11_9FUNG|nr:hypothetical protein BC938DRAFT_479359 [Jimgerdemannia flammicorona]